MNAHEWSINKLNWLFLIIGVHVYLGVLKLGINRRPGKIKVTIRSFLGEQWKIINVILEALYWEIVEREDRWMFSQRRKMEIKKYYKAMSVMPFSSNILKECMKSCGKTNRCYPGLAAVREKARTNSPPFLFFQKLTASKCLRRGCLNFSQP